MAIYKNCVCFASKITCTPIVVTSASTEVVCFIMFEDHNGRHITNALNGFTKDFLMENSHDIRKRFIYSYSYQQPPRRFSYYRTTKSLEQTRNLDEQYWLTSSASPDTHTYAGVGCAFFQSGITTQTSTARLNITITYYCKIWDRIDLDG